jgi:hypothetical protein
MYDPRRERIYVLLVLAVCNPSYSHIKQKDANIKMTCINWAKTDKIITHQENTEFAGFVTKSRNPYTDVY